MAQHCLLIVVLSYYLTVKSQRRGFNARGICWSLFPIGSDNPKFVISPAESPARLTARRRLNEDYEGERTLRHITSSVCPLQRMRTISETTEPKADVNLNSAFTALLDLRTFWKVILWLRRASSKPTFRTLNLVSVLYEEAITASQAVLTIMHSVAP